MARPNGQITSDPIEGNLFDTIEKTFKRVYNGWEGAGQFSGSGKRLRNLVEEMCWPSRKIEEEVSKCLQAVFADKYDEMLVTKFIEVWTLCPHHLLPCNFNVKIGYIPIGGVLGLSKFTRISVTLGKRPIMQEQYTREVADTLWEGLKPEGLGIYVIGKHGCMGCRGVNQPNVEVVTSTLRGSFKANHTVREEFYAICRGV